LNAFRALKNYVDYFKIGSYELLYTDLIETVARTGKPWIISTGMESFNLKKDSSNQKDFMINVRKATRIGRLVENSPFVILACNSNYPAKPEDCNLRNIAILSDYFIAQKIGWSDHTVEPGVIYKAISLGAEYIEFHFDLEDGMGYEYKIGHCWKPNQIKKVIHDVRIGEVAENNIFNTSNEKGIARWRMDPVDGMRPLRLYRKELLRREK
jgi:N-acetylneuraminate synthase